MGLNDTPSSERMHIGFFGKRNAGKSSLVNAVTGQEMSVVSGTKGTTTDPVMKSMELLPMGPVVIIDTPGFDDEGELGEKRVRKTKQTLNRTDVAVLVVDAQVGLGTADKKMVSLFKEKEIPFLIAYNKCDLLQGEQPETEHAIFVSAQTGKGIFALKEKIAHMQKPEKEQSPLVEDLVEPGQIVLLVIPIDKAAPKGRMILPQQMMLRGLLDKGAIPVCVKEDGIGDVLAKLSQKPSLVITDSQVFAKVARVLPGDIPLTSFSILMARYKGFLEEAVHGAEKIDALRDGDCVLISEGCTHHRQCGDIGTVKLPAWLKERTGANLSIDTSSGKEFPDDLSSYALVIHCGACMLGEREVQARMKQAKEQGIPMTNYGTAIAHMKGILRRSTEIFADLWKEV